MQFKMSCMALFTDFVVAMKFSLHIRLVFLLKTGKTSEDYCAKNIFKVTKMYFFYFKLHYKTM